MTEGRTVNNGRTNGSGINDWILIVAAICIFWPLGAYLLFRKLMGDNKGFKSGRSGTSFSYNSQYEYHYSAQDLKNGRKTAHGAACKPEQTNPVQSSLKKGKVMSIVGGAMAALFGITGISKLIEYTVWGGLRYALPALFSIFGLCAVGLVLLYAGLFRTRKGKRFQKYLNTIGRQKKIAVSTLAGATGYSVSKVCNDLDEMLEMGIFPVGYLDRAGATLILSEEGVQEPPKEEPKATVEAEYAILKEIQEVNDAIPDALMSGKINRIAAITQKILDYQKKNPGQDAELRSFLDYYLPTTLKILRAYAQLDAQGISGENINSAKTRIEGMMDKVVDGFEKQLDRLFQSETMDITSDIHVLEQMLKKDGLSSDGEGFQLKL